MPFTKINNTIFESVGYGWITYIKDIYFYIVGWIYMDKKFKKIIKIQLIIFTLILFVGYAGSTAELIQNSEAKIAFDKNDFKVYFSEYTHNSGKAAAFRSDYDNSLSVYTYSSSLKQGDSGTIDFTITNNSSQYDAYVYVEPDTSNQKEADFNYDDYFEYELTNFKQNEPVLVKAKESEKGKITITVKKDIPDKTSLQYEIKLTIKITSIERTEKATPKYHTVTFDPNGGECTELTRIVEEGTKIGKLPTPTRDEYKFTYWMNAKNYAMAWESDYIMEDMTYKAQWEPTINEIFYDANGGTGTMENSKFDINKHGNLRKNTFVRPEYIFKGWAFKPDATTPDFADEATFKDNALFKRHDIKLYAVWRKEIMDTAIEFTPDNTTLKQLGYTVEETNRTIKAGLTEVKVYEIKKDGKLVTSINIPEYYTYENQKYHITTIGKEYDINVFTPNDTLEEIIMPDSIEVLGSTAFAYYSKLSKVRFSNNLKILGLDSFLSCTSLTSITLPETVKIVGVNAFNNCTSLTSITLPAELKEIGTNAFMNTKLNSIVIPGSVTTIGSSAFYGTDNLKTIVINEGVKEIGDYAFYDSALTKVIIPSTVTSIGSSAFSFNKYLAQVYIKSTNVTLGKECFNHLKEGTTSAYGSTIYVRNSSIRDTLLSNKHDEYMSNVTDYITISNKGVMSSDTRVTQVSTNYNWKI